MAFNSFDFIIFFPIITLIYFLIPKKLRTIWLLLTSYYFYMGWNPAYALLILSSTVVTYICGILMDKSQNQTYRKSMLILTISLNITILCVFKYANFLLDNLYRIFHFTGLQITERHLDLLLPVGISFYTFQALGYIIDVYRKEIPAEKNFINYALFVSFFPQLVAGPIERSKNLLTQVQNVSEHSLWEYERVRDGFLLMLWGFFQKLVIADRAAIFVKHVFNNYNSYGLIEISIAAILFAVEIYCDFGGYTNIARGAARILGFDLMQNFKQPYFATSIKEFWRRWHISLTTWFTDYLYIPLGGNRNGELRKYVNIFIVFCVSGLWHGASWNFIIWGFLHALFQIVENIKDKYFNKQSPKPMTVSTRLRKTITTFIFVDFAWIFFASESFITSLKILRQMFTNIHTPPSLLNLVLNVSDWKILLFSIIVLFLVDLLHEKNISIFRAMTIQEVWFKIIIVLFLMWSIIMFGVFGPAYDTSTFIYFQF